MFFHLPMLELKLLHRPFFYTRDEKIMRFNTGKEYEQRLKELTVRYNNPKLKTYISVQARIYPQDLGHIVSKIQSNRRLTPDEYLGLQGAISSLFMIITQYSFVRTFDAYALYTIDWYHFIKTCATADGKFKDAVWIVNNFKFYVTGFILDIGYREMYNFDYFGMILKNLKNYKPRNTNLIYVNKPGRLSTKIHYIYKHFTTSIDSYHCEETTLDNLMAVKFGAKHFTKKDKGFILDIIDELVNSFPCVTQFERRVHGLSVEYLQDPLKNEYMYKRIRSDYDHTNIFRHEEHRS